MFKNNNLVKIDLCHSLTLKGLIYSHKPTRVLELGLGGAQSLDAILDALSYNQQKYEYTLVDNWYDYGYKMPSGVREMYQDKVNIVTSSEENFVFSTNQKYDFIFSDADHLNAQKWFEHVYDNLLNDDGILAYHDINLIEDGCFNNLREIYYTCQKRNLKFKLFNKNSLPDERCQRGLLVIFK
jgi:predicted O-methyltransferase YrrM